MTASRYETIKKDIVAQIESGSRLPGDPVPSENKLAEQYDVSRMTARRALTELTHAGVLSRSQGTGTFVAEQLPTGSLLEIRSIDAEITERGHEHSSQVLHFDTLHADAKQAAELHIKEGDKIFFSRLLHFETNTTGQTLPIQLEERFVNSAAAPDYDQQDFSQTTPSAYLSLVSPLNEADHWVEACLPTKEIADWLKMTTQQPCLKLTRKTFSVKTLGKKTQKQIVTIATLFHPGEHYRLGGHLVSGET